VKKIVVWLIAALLLQFGIWGYLDRVIFAPSAAFTQPPDPTLAISYSYDKAYYSEISGHDLQIYSSLGHRLTRDISLKDNESVSYFSWLPDRNLALAGVSFDFTKTTTVSLLSIDPETNSQPVSPEVSGLALGARIESVAFSTKTNVTNILVKDRYGTAVYRTDANNYLRRLTLGDSHINRIASLRYQDTILYDDTVAGSVYAYVYGGRVAKVPLGTRQHYALIGTDQSDNVYLGELNNQKLVTAIFEGKINGDFTQIKSLDPAYPVNSIKVTYDGTISFS